MCQNKPKVFQGSLMIQFRFNNQGVAKWTSLFLEQTSAWQGLWPCHQPVPGNIHFVWNLWATFLKVPPFFHLSLVIRVSTREFHQLFPNTWCLIFVSVLFLMHNHVWYIYKICFCLCIYFLHALMLLPLSLSRPRQINEMNKWKPVSLNVCKSFTQMLLTGGENR